MAAPKVYRWDDSNAPSLACNSTNTSKLFVALLKACLVDGYGDKTPPGEGYSLEYENAEGTAIALRSNNPLSNGFWFQIATANAYNDTTGSDITFAYINIYEHMQSAISGKINGITDSLYRVAYTSSYPDSPVPWVVVADDRFFYVFIYNAAAFRVSQSPDIEAAYAHSCGCAGDFVSLCDDPWSTIVWGFDYGSNQGSTFGNLSQFHPGYLTNYFGIKRAITGEAGAASGLVCHGGGPLYVGQETTSAMGYGGTGLTAEYSDELPVIISRPFIAENGDNVLMRGYLPGLYYPCHSKPFDNLAEVTIGGVSYLAVSIVAYNGKVGQVLISLDDWRA